MINIRSTGKEFNGQLEIELQDDPYNGVTFYYESMKFGDENDDGSVTMTFDYQITSNNPPKKLKEFEQYIGDLIIQILEEQIKHNEVVYKGGAGGTYTYEQA